MFELIKKLFKRKKKEDCNLSEYIPEEILEKWSKEEEIFSGYLGHIAEKHHG